ncbi:MAG: 2,3,4,5-tetrahydropyridine-2,6-dicarboxylate N-acetyltransferase [Aminipila sp.]
METREIIELIKKSERKTPVKVYIKESEETLFPNCKTFKLGETAEETNKLVFGEWEDIETALKNQKNSIIECVVEGQCRNSILSLLDTKKLEARIEPGAIIRENVKIESNAIIMMGAIINIGSEVGSGSMIDMGAILGARATVGKNCHIGAGTVLAGVLEPPGAKPVIIEDDVVIGANAVVLEGCTVGKGAIVGAGAVVTKDVPENTVVVGVPARVIKMREDISVEKTEILPCLREL